MSPSRVVSNDVPSPLVTPPSDPISASMSFAPPMTPEKLPIAEDRPSTVPTKPRIGMAQMNTLIRE